MPRVPHTHQGLQSSSKYSPCEHTLNVFALLSSASRMAHMDEALTSRRDLRHKPRISRA